MFTLAQSYNSGYRRRIANRSGELRHEEFSHCCVHESVDSERESRRTLLYNFCRTVTLNFWRKEEINKEYKTNSEKLFLKSNFLLFLCFALVLSVPDGTLGLKRYRARRAIIAGAKQWFLRLLYFQKPPISLILLTKGMKTENYIMGQNKQNR